MPLVNTNMCADYLFYVSRADIFSVYPTILQELLIVEELRRTRKVTPLGFTVSTDQLRLQLPSEFEWQLKQYFRLLEQQKKINAATESGM